jgi:PhnB protein
MEGEIIMSMSLFINFNGNCREAVDYYAEVFGSEKSRLLTFGEMPADPNMPLPEEAKNLVAYVDVKVLDFVLMCSDVFPGTPFVQGNNITICVGTEDIEMIDTLFNKLKEGGTVTMELQETFWSKRYGMLVDKFGIPWMFSHDSGYVIGG